MEAITPQLGAGREVAAGGGPSSPASKQELHPYSNNLKPNQVGETSLYGVPIVSLVIDGQERLCLAQISNTLLKNYSYNEIHNRRVALGITCVQCTPVQLEILRRAGAMPISSRRCGMITKREAERLCKSFLGEHRPPKLPENFAFDVVHECAWGSRGSFIPARYNSSRAKCIKCAYCSLYFSPNKFIFHSHRTPEAKYTQPDAANFNSWRRHLRLSERTATEELSHSWEDVKAMFNGGTRKRTFSLHSGSGGSSSKGAGHTHHHHTHHPHHVPPQPHHTTHGLHPPPSSGDLPPPKALRCSSTEDERPSPGSAPAPSSSAGLRPYPVIPVPSKGGFGVLQKIPPPLFPHPYGFPAFSLCTKKDEGNGLGDPGKASGGGSGGAGLPGMFWPTAATKDALYPPFPMFWPAAAGALPYPMKSSVGRVPDVVPPAGGDETNDRNTPKEAGEGDSRPEEEPQRSGDEEGGTGPPPPPPLTPRSRLSYISAFRPVVKDAESIAKLYGSRDLPALYGTRGGYLSPDPLLSEGESLRSASPDLRSASPSTDLRSASPGTDVDVESNRFPDDEDEEEPEEEDKVGRREPQPTNEEDEEAPLLEEAVQSPARGSPGYQVYPQDRDPAPGHSSPRSGGAPAATYLCSSEAPEPDAEDSHSAGEDSETRKSFQEQRNPIPQTSPHASDRGEEGIRLEVTGAHLVERDIENMAKDELQKLLVEQMDLRKKLEREFQSLKDNFQDQMKRELAYREEMVQQLQIVRDTLCNELDQERKARYAIQQKLKDADTKTLHRELLLQASSLAPVSHIWIPRKAMFHTTL